LGKNDKILASLVKEQTLDDESLQTLMCEAENIINGRPLTAISDDPKDLFIYLFIKLRPTITHKENKKKTTKKKNKKQNGQGSPPPRIIFYYYVRKLLFHQIFSKQISCFQGQGGCKSNIWLTSSGIDGKESIFHCWSSAKSGYAQEEISQ